MTNVGSLDASRETVKPERHGWRELYLKEDWWAVWLGLGLVVFAIVLFQAGNTNIIKALAINPGGLKWTSFAQLVNHFTQNAQLYLYQFLFWLGLFGVTAAIMGAKLKEFVPLRLRTLVDEVMERNRLELEQELETFREQLKHGIHEGGGLLGRTAEFLVGQRGL